VTLQRRAVSRFGKRRRIAGAEPNTGPLAGMVSTDSSDNAASVSKFSLQRGEKFREEIGNGLRLGLTPEPRPPNTKPEKEIKL
jgi:hypothetical protein